MGTLTEAPNHLLIIMCWVKLFIISILFVGPNSTKRFINPRFILKTIDLLTFYFTLIVTLEPGVIFVAWPYMTHVVLVSVTLLTHLFLLSLAIIIISLTRRLLNIHPSLNYRNVL